MKKFVLLSLLALLALLAFVVGYSVCAQKYHPASSHHYHCSVSAVDTTGRPA